MPNKALMIGASVVVAGLVLLLTVLVGGPGSGGGDDTSDVSINWDEIHVPEDGTSAALTIGEAEGIVYELKESGILFFANRIVPRAEGEIDAIDTSIRIHFAPGRELTIDADEGTIVAPDNHPQEGQMRGNVVVTLFETPDGSEVDFDSERHVVIRMYFDDPVEFDLELQQIDSEGPIFMTGPQIQYRGRGLSLNYNQLRQRIERLVIEEGESLRYIPETVAPDTAPVTAEAGSPAVASNAPDQPREKRSDVTPDDQSTDPTTAQDDKADRPVQYYLATFEQLDAVRVGDDQYVIEGDDLSAVFSTKAAHESEAPPGPSTSGPLTPRERVRVRAAVQDVPGRRSARINTTGPHPGPLPRGEGEDPGRSLSLASSDPMSAALAYALSASLGQMPDTDARSLATFTEEDVVITWAGRLVVSPLNDDDVPVALAGPDDMMVAVRGTPAKIRTDRGETVRAPKVSFFSLNAGLLAEGTADSPVTVDSPDMGSLVGTELAIDQTLGSGHVIGPGTLTGQVRDKSDDAQTDTRPIAVSFDDRLNLAFYLKQENTPKEESNKPVKGGRVKGVKTADFLGNVRVDYDELDLTADRLTLSLLEDAPDALERDDKLSVESIEAIGNVEAFVKEEDVRIYADRLAADPANNQLELFGSPEVPARVVRPDATLAGEHLVMDEQGKTVTVPGPGSFDFLPDANDTGKTVHVTWVKRMHYDDTAGTAHFLGNVKTRSTDGADTNELMGDDLALTFVKDESADGVKTDPTSGGGDVGRRLASATMTRNVRFRARSYATAQRQQMQTELYLLGPRMEFTDPGPPEAPNTSNDAAQQVQVIGVGRMLITDTRPKDGATANTTPGAGAIDMAGRGKTAFQWSDRLILDLTHGEMLMKGAVAMVHQPAAGSSGDRGDRVQLDCLDLAAEMQKTPGSKKGGDGWLSDDAPKPELNRVWADGGIRIISGDITVTCDHLLYEETKREIILWSDDPNVVVYQVAGEPVPAKSSAFKWHRDTGRVEAFRLRTGTIPLRRTEREQ
jgi:lipopolysaccharide export system protein LptA